MAENGLSPREILGKLEQIEAAVSNGETIASAAANVGVTEHTYHQWRRKYNYFPHRPSFRVGQMIRITSHPDDRLIGRTGILVELPESDRFYRCLVWLDGGPANNEAFKGSQEWLFPFALAIES
jgi:hypothetical protein